MEETTATTETKPETPTPATPRVRTMRRPAPVPAGHIGVEIYDTPPELANLWYLVKLDPSCEVCTGTGRMLIKGDGPFGTREDYCETCIKPAVREEIKKEVAAIDSMIANHKADRGDAMLLKRLEDARAKVASMEAERDAALAGNKEEQAATEAKIVELRAQIETIKIEAAERDTDQQGVLVAFIERDKAAREEHASLIRQANEMLAEKQRVLAEERKRWAAEWGQERLALDNKQYVNARDIEHAEAALKRLSEGPAKMVKRWEEKLQPARATLARLERRYNGGGE